MAGSDESQVAPARKRKVLKLSNWTCYSCGLELVDRLKRVKGVKDVTLNLFTQQVSVDHEGADMEEVMRVINRLGLKVAGSEAK